MKTLYILIIALFFFVSCTSTQIAPIEIEAPDWNEFRSEWIDLDAEHYHSYATNNAAKFNEAPTPMWHEARFKWKDYFPNELFPALLLIQQAQESRVYPDKKHGNSGFILMAPWPGLIFFPY